MGNIDWFVFPGVCLTAGLNVLTSSADYACAASEKRWHVAFPTSLARIRRGIRPALPPPQTPLQKEETQSKWRSCRQRDLARGVAHGRRMSWSCLRAGAFPHPPPTPFPPSFACNGLFSASVRNTAAEMRKQQQLTRTCAAGGAVQVHWKALLPTRGDWERH
eukprot:483846-Rhodomonas_salina.2